MLDKLVELGLNEKEAKVYLSLLDLGETTIGPLEKMLGIHKQIIYNLLNNLHKEKLINVIIKNGRKYFSPNNFEILLEKNEKRKQLIETLIPEMYVRSGKAQNVGEIKIYEGDDAFRSFHQKMLKKMIDNSCLYVIGAGGDDFLKIMQKKYFFDKYENLRINKKIAHKLLMYENQRNVNTEYVKRRYVEAKFLPDIFHQPMAIQIWQDRISIAIFGDKPQIIEIPSPKIREGFINYFDILWKIGKK